MRLVDTLVTYYWLCFYTASYSVKIFTFADDLSRLQKSIIFVQKKKPKHGVQIDMTSTDTETLWKLAEISKSAMKSQYHHVKHIPVTRQKFWQNTNIRAETFENCKTTVSTAQLCAVVAARRNCEICLAMDCNVLRRTLYLQQKHRQQQHLFVLWATVPASKAFTIMIPSQHCCIQQTFLGI